MVEVTINLSQVMEVISTIAQSTSVENYREIPRDYFFMKDQKLNKKCIKEGGEAYKQLKAKLILEINNPLKSMMMM